jgi:hypothetical protein
MSAVASPAAVAGQAEASLWWKRWLAPSLLDLTFIALMVWMFVTPKNGWSGLLDDGDTGWHIRAGDWILANGRAPTQDLFSLVKGGEPWFAWEWGADILYSALHSAWGLKGVVLLSGLLIVVFAVVLCRYMLWRGANPFLSLLFTMLAFSATSIHFLARPHLFTLLLIPVLLWMIEADERRPGWRIWLLVPLTALWTNLHGGFIAGLALLGLLAIGRGIEAVWNRGGAPVDWRPAQRYGSLTAACLAATFLNPYGWGLHAHIVEYLRSDWIRLAVSEFRSPIFRDEPMFHYELLMMAALMAAALLLARRRVVEPLWILFWAHQSLVSVRNVTVFVTVAAPIVAWEATRFWDQWVRGAPRKSLRGIFGSLARELAVTLPRASVWPAVFVLALALDFAPSRWPQDFPGDSFPTAFFAKHREKIESGRVFTTDEWGDYLIYRYWPKVRVFADGRSDFLGPEMGKEYIRMVEGRSDWHTLIDKYAFDVVVVPPNLPLATLLKASRGWRLVEDDGEAILFQKVRNNTRVEAETGSKAPLKNSPSLG